MLSTKDILYSLLLIEYETNYTRVIIRKQNVFVQKGYYCGVDITTRFLKSKKYTFF